MAQFRKRPVVIEAEQFTATHRPADICMGGCVFASLLPHVHTIDGGALYAEEGDWIIRGVQGERYPCKPDIFALTYEPVEEGG